MTRKIRVVAPLALAAFVLSQPLSAGSRTGTIKGRITDNQGFALQGATIYANSAAQIGIRRFITSGTGLYGFPNLPPGTYKVTAEMPGFKTINITGIALDPGATVSLDFKMEPSDTEEEVTRPSRDAGIDRESPRVSTVLDSDILRRIPMPRDFSAVLGLVPGIVFVGDNPGFLASITGGSATNNVFIEGGSDVTDPVTQGSLSRINVDLIDEVVVDSSAVPADRLPGQGATINVIQQSGGNSFSGGLLFAYTGRGLTSGLWPSQELETLNLPAPPMTRSDLDFSLTAGGPILQDTAWFFTNFRYRPQSQTTVFQGYTDPLNISNTPFNLQDRDFSWIFKLSVRVLSRYQGTAELALSSINQSVFDSDLAWNRPESTTQSLDNGFLLRGRFGLTYEMDQDTFTDLWLNFTNSTQPLLLNSASSSSPSYYDIGTGYYFGSGPYNDVEKRKRFLIEASITRLQDRLLGTSHEFIAGVDYEAVSSSSSVWKPDNLIMYYLNGSPYTLGEALSPVSGKMVGEGLIGFYDVPQTEGGMDVTSDLRKLGLFGQDTLKIGSRMTLSLGLRFDHGDIMFEPLNKSASGNPISVTLGTDQIEPIDAINPYSVASFAEWDSAISWNTLSPRAGLTIDIFGRGKTLFKASYARIPEDLGLGYAINLDPLSPGQFNEFYWYDENHNGLVDPNDTFVLVPSSYNMYDSEYYTQRVAPNLSAPVMQEWTAGFEQSLTSDFSLSVRYISRSEGNIIGDVLYDPTSGRPWYSAQNSPDGWWIPFSTVVPGGSGYPDTPVTVYLQSTSAPSVFNRIQNVPELVRRYRGLEFSFRKRMSHNWQLFGSLVWSRSTGTSSPASPWSMGGSAPPLTPNDFVNVSPNSRTDLDRPLVIRLMGTFRLPYDIYLSAGYTFMSGAPWARSVTIFPPADWAAANGAQTAPVTVFLDSPGTYRYSSVQETDIRLEKEFVRKGRARLSLSVDALNVFGNKSQIIDGNDGGLWYPDGEGTSSGERIISGTYGQIISLTGTRTIRFTLRVGF